ELAWLDPSVGFVDRSDVDGDIVAEHSPLFRVPRKPVKRGERIGWQRRHEPLDDIAIVIVMRWLDENQFETSPPHDRRIAEIPFVSRRVQHDARLTARSRQAINTIMPNASRVQKDPRSPGSFPGAHRRTIQLARRCRLMAAASCRRNRSCPRSAMTTPRAAAY